MAEMNSTSKLGMPVGQIYMFYLDYIATCCSNPIHVLLCFRRYSSLADSTLVLYNCGVCHNTIGIGSRYKRHPVTKFRKAFAERVTSRRRMEQALQATVSDFHT